MNTQPSPDETVIRFASALARQRQVDLDTLHPHARIIVTGPFATNSPESYSPLLCEWLVLAAAAANSLPRTPDNVMQVRRIAGEFIAFVFSFPGNAAAEPPATFHDHPMGRILDLARFWAEQDELISLSEAAAMVGVSIPAINQNKHLAAFYNPLATNRQQGYRWVKRSEVVEYYRDRKGWQW